MFSAKSLLKSFSSKTPSKSQSNAKQSKRVSVRFVKDAREFGALMPRVPTGCLIPATYEACFGFADNERESLMDDLGLTDKELIDAHQAFANHAVALARSRNASYLFAWFNESTGTIMVGTGFTHEQFCLAMPVLTAAIADYAVLPDRELAARRTEDARSHLDFAVHTMSDAHSWLALQYSSS